MLAGPGSLAWPALLIWLAEPSWPGGPARTSKPDKAAKESRRLGNSLGRGETGDYALRQLLGAARLSFKWLEARPKEMRQCGEFLRGLESAIRIEKGVIGARFFLDVRHYAYKSA